MDEILKHIEQMQATQSHDREGAYADLQAAPNSSNIQSASSQAQQQQEHQQDARQTWAPAFATPPASSTGMSSCVVTHATNLDTPPWAVHRAVCRAAQSPYNVAGQLE